MSYVGHRILLQVQLGKMKDKIQIDTGICESSTYNESHFTTLQYKGVSLYEKSISLLMYPAELIFAEKLEAITSKGDFNSRMKDYHDLLLMVRHSNLLSDSLLLKSIEATFSIRNTLLKIPITFEIDGITTLQALWENHLLGLAAQKDKLKLPTLISEVIFEINEKLLLVLDPVMT